jgi:hypothetical protein
MRAEVIMTSRAHRIRTLADAARAISWLFAVAGCGSSAISDGHKDASGGALVHAALPDGAAR